MLEVLLIIYEDLLHTFKYFKRNCFICGYGGSKQLRKYGVNGLIFWAILFFLWSLPS